MNRSTRLEAATERRPMKDLAISRGHIKPAAKLRFDFPGRTAHFDHSANNLLNSDSSKEVGWGDQSWDEMRVGFLHLVFDAKMPLRELFPSTREPRVEVAQ